MTNRIIDIANASGKVKVHNDQLIVEQQSLTSQAPLDEVGVLVLGHPHITITGAVLAGLMAKGSSCIVCDGRHSPVGILLPLQSHHLQSERFSKQAESGLSVRKRLWRQLVRAKIGAQSRLLLAMHGDDAGLTALVPRVRSGDPDNQEAQAAVRYWKKLFGNREFRRGAEAGVENNYLNYGYGVLRATTGRAICAAGLHPGLGLHHHNRYDNFPLASDLMEPFRPLVDKAVVELVQSREGMEQQLDTEAKRVIVAALIQRFTIKGEERTLFDILNRTASSLAKVYLGKRRTLILPEL
ncbi:MAG: CRISPR-associated endonuclease Cas1 [Candidatus Hydrogenedentota bacterium]